MQNYHMILASASLRRQQLLRDAGFTFEVRLRETEERYPAGLPSEQVPEYLARLKASVFLQDLRENELLVTADTVVCIHDKIIGKPADRGEAIAMLSELSGNRHEVITGVCVTTCAKQVVFSSVTSVFFRELHEKEIEYYVDHYQPFDKAGAYGIQEWIGYVGIERIEGSFYNVMGLPVQKLYDVLREF